MKKKRFWFHYNKPASRKRGKPQITVHWGGKCLIVDNLKCEVPTEGHIKNQQPLFVVRGWAEEIKIENQVAHIV